MDLVKKCSTIIYILKKTYPDASCALHFSNNVQLLVSTILSAQCTDKRVNIVTKNLFKKYKTANDFSAARLKNLEKDIKSTGFYRNKAKNIQGACRSIVDRFDGRVPDTMEGLTSLPGVGRKTANVVLGVGFGKAEGVVVDTHVTRLSNRLGFTRNKNPVKIEEDLVKLIPRKDWINFSHLLIAHGRAMCIARKPKCPQCPVKNSCPSAGKFHPALKEG